MDFWELLLDNFDLMRREHGGGVTVRALAVTASDVPTVLGLDLRHLRSIRALATARSLHRADGIPAGAGAGGAAVRQNGLESVEPAIPHGARENPSNAWTSLQTAICISGTFWSSKHAGAKTPVECDHCLKADYSTEECVWASAAEFVYRPSKAKPLNATQSLLRKSICGMKSIKNSLHPYPVPGVLFALLLEKRLFSMYNMLFPRRYTLSTRHDANSGG